MNGIDIAVIVCVSVLAVALAAYFIVRKVKRKNGGCCGCCSECGMCAHADKTAKCSCSDKGDETESVRTETACCDATDTSSMR